MLTNAVEIAPTLEGLSRGSTWLQGLHEVRALSVHTTVSVSECYEAGYHDYPSPVYCIHESYDAGFHDYLSPVIAVWIQ